MTKHAQFVRRRAAPRQTNHPTFYGFFAVMVRRYVDGHGGSSPLPGPRKLATNGQIDPSTLPINFGWGKKRNSYRLTG